MKSFSLIFCSCLIAAALQAQIIHVPADYPTIQQAIDTANTGDTVLVSPGTYVENINFNGKNITVASLFLTTQDTSYISQTIIDGNQAGSVVTISEGTPFLSGFTITNGNSSGGGGISIGGSSSAFPILQNLKIENNTAQNGGGIGCFPGGSNGSHVKPYLLNVVIINNTANSGGGLYFSSSVGPRFYCCSGADIQDVTISGNYASQIGGGIFLETDEDNIGTSFKNVTINNNIACQHGGGIYVACIMGTPSFDSNDRCNIYLNAAYEGNDLFSAVWDTYIIKLDTFSVLNPTEYFAAPLSKFSFDIQHGYRELVNADLYVSPTTGNDSNSGLTADEPLKTIHSALSFMLADNLNPHTIHLLEGTYSHSNNGEFFPVIIPEFISLEGVADSLVILDAGTTGRVIQMTNNSFSTISGITIKGGSGSGIYCDNSSPLLHNLVVTYNDGNGILFSNSSPALQNIFITNNNGSGISCENSSPELSNVTITCNASSQGGGIFSSNSTLSFDSINRCNIYMNMGNEGSDIYSNTFLEVVVDTFTVLNPNEFHAAPFSNFSFDILHGYHEQVNADLFVSPAGDNNNNGLTADEPLKTINSAISFMLADSLNPHTIHLLEGTYSPSGNNEFFPLIIPEFINLEGTSDTSVILDAESMGEVIRMNGNSSSVISGMTIKNGSGRGINLYSSRPTLHNLIISNNNGGGIACYNNSNPNVSNATITGNSAESWGYGMGIFCENSSPTLEDVIISGNSANTGDGGGIFCDNSSPVLRNVTITGNSVSYFLPWGWPSAGGHGGGIYCSNNSNPQLENVLIANNTTEQGGGIYCSNSSNPSLKDVTITNNLANLGEGGGIFCSNSIPLFNSINRCNIYLNNSNTRYGLDLYSDSHLDVIVDTFTVLYPNLIYAKQFRNFSFDILNGKILQVNSDIFVSPEGDDMNTGMTEDNPVKTIYHATSFIVADSLHRNVIRLMEGIYSQSATEEYFPIILPDYSNLEGNADSSVIIDGEGQGKVILMENNRQSSISELTITGGSENGIYCSSSTPTFQNLRITNNGTGVYCSSSDPMMQNLTIYQNVGSGIACYDFSTPFLSNVTITNNSAEQGGGIFCSNSSLLFDSINRCNIYLNSANEGNDIYSDCFQNVMIDTFTVMHPAGYHAFPLSNFEFSILNSIYEQTSDGVYISPQGDNSNNGLTKDHPLKTIKNAYPRLGKDNTGNNVIHLLEGTYSPSTNGETLPISLPDFIDLEGIADSLVILDAENTSNLLSMNNNTSNNISGLTITGGSAYLGGGVAINNSNVKLKNITLSDNKADACGGAIYCYNSELFLTNSSILNNSAGNNCGGIYGVASKLSMENARITGNKGVWLSNTVNFLWNSSSINLVNVTIANNDEAAISCDGTTVVENSTITGNSTNFGSGGIQCNSNTVITNSIIWNNIPEGTTGPAIITYSDIQGGFQGVGNIDEDPLFVGNGEHPFILTSSSPCRNAGTPDTTGLYLPLYDLAGGPRIWEDRIDMGAYEWNNVGIDDFGFRISDFGLKVYPNPFTSATTIKYTLEESVQANLRIYDNYGRLVAEPVNAFQQKGEQKVEWIADDLPVGIYYCRLQAGNKVVTNKIVKMH